MLLSDTGYTGHVRFLGKGFGVAVLAVGLFLKSTIATALPTSTVYFAGIAYTSNASNVEQTFPHVSKALASGGNTTLDNSVRSSIQGQSLPETISFDSLGSVKDASKSVALALGLDAESASVEHIGDVYKLRVEVSAEALFFDFKEKQVLGGFPFIIDFITVSPTPPTDADIQKAFEGLLFGTDGMHSLTGEFVKTLSRAQVPLASSKHLRVTSSTLDTKAVDYLHQYAPQVDAAAIPQQVAQAFGTYLASNQRLSVLPYSSNQALGSSMAARFIEGESYDLKIPEADYDIRINVAGFKKINQSSSSVATVYLYGAFVDLTVLEPLSNHVYFSQRIKQGQTKTVPTAQTNVDDWSPAYDTLKTLFFNFTSSLSDPHNPWLKSGLPSDAQAQSQFQSLGELIQSCR
ncbi:hypothetical protein [Dyella psychrodurans]|uniref:Uncharacterized protein n=1 Tax=Dyella psychrodurans TaxID=1927960 RepID=A0A370XD12_9GAMM|nr:hypothetical protein [Dyella psychrodurans]RDS86298.1 hypothetical protein DWU99_03290 [Dyella psychrodurans]